jgi:hypothetical protein
MKQDIALKRSHEQQSRGARIGYPEDPGVHGAPEVVGDEHEGPSRRVVGFGIEGKHQRGARRVLVHGDDDACGEDGLDERDHVLREAAQNGARVARRVDVRQFADACRRLHHLAALHGLIEELLLGADVAEDGGRRDAELAGDVGEGCGGEPFAGEELAGGGEELVTPDARWASHL